MSFQLPSAIPPKGAGDGAIGRPAVAFSSSAKVATTVLATHVVFAEVHADIEWRNRRVLRKRIAHVDFNIDLGIVCDTVATSLPKL